MSAKLLGTYLPAAMSSLHFDLHFSDYPTSIAAAGGLPVELARDADVEGIIERLDGLVLSGGTDVDPSLYGHESHPNLGALEPERDEWELALLKAALKRGIPVLAICRGFQLVNVAFGGTLHQHVELDQGSGHPQWDVDGRTATHEVRILADTLTSKFLPERWSVNSLHHQTLDRVGEGLTISAIAPDGVVEGLETFDGNLIAVQWHPELLKSPDPTFAWLVSESMIRLR